MIKKFFREIIDMISISKSINTYEEVENSLLDKVCTILTIVIMSALPVMYFIGECIDEKVYCQEEIVVGTLICALALFCVRYFKRESINVKVFDVLIIILIVSTIASTIFSKELYESTIGIKKYRELGIHWWGLFSAYLISSCISNIKQKRKVMFSLLIISIVESIIGILQRYKLIRLFNTEGLGKERVAFGFTQNCNYFAALTSIFTAIFVTLFILEKNKARKIMFYIGMILCFLTSIFTAARIAWLGDLTAILTILIIEVITYKVNKNKIRLKNMINNILLVIATFTITILILFLAGDDSVTSQIAEFENDAENLMEDQLEEFGSSRGIIWKKGFNALTHDGNLLIGTGVNNYVYVYNYCDDEVINIKAITAHCEYLNLLVTQGLFALITYLTFLATIVIYACKKIIKTNENRYNYAFLVATVSYCMQAAVNSNVLNVSIYMWILLGIITYRNESKTIYVIKRK